VRQVSPAPGCLGRGSFFTKEVNKMDDLHGKPMTMEDLEELVTSRGQDIDDLTQKLSDLEETKAQQLMGRDETINKLKRRTLEEFITAIVDDKIDIALPSAADTAQDVIDEIDSYQVWDMVSDQCSELIREVLNDAKVTIEA
jgi:NAD(P)H-dependent flavin oxidoreductase YrpB (nitropropane dioxygenase family)